MEKKKGPKGERSNFNQKISKNWVAKKGEGQNIDKTLDYQWDQELEVKW